MAVLVITSLMVAPSIQQFIAKSEMQSLQNGFSQALGRARAQAASLNTCVSLCQLAANSTTACNAAAANRGQWHQGWMAFENRTCTTPTAAQMADMTTQGVIDAGYRVLYVRQPGNGRFTLQSSNPASASLVLTYNPRGLLQASPDTFALRDTRDEALATAVNLVLNAQGRIKVSKFDQVADANSTTAGNEDEESTSTDAGSGSGTDTTSGVTPDAGTAQGGQP